MNSGEVVVCDYCERPFEVRVDHRFDTVFCPYCRYEQ